MKNRASFKRWLNANPWRWTVFVFIVPFFVSAVAVLVGFDTFGRTQFMTDLVFGLLAAFIAYSHQKQIISRQEKGTV